MSDDLEDGADAGEPAPGAAGPEGEPRRRRRRRRKRPGDVSDAPEGQASVAAAGERPAPQPQRPPQQPRPQAQRPPQQQRPPQDRERGQRGGGRRDDRRDRGPREQRRPDGAPPPAAREARTYEPPTQRLEQQQRKHVPDDLDPDAAPEPTGIPWGSEDDTPPPPIVLAPDLPADPRDDDDPLTQPLIDGPGATLGDDVASVAGVRFVPGGRLQWFDAGDAEYAIGERVIVDAERGQRLGWIASPPARRTVRDRGLRRVVRRANDHDLRGERDGEADRANALRIAKDKAAALRLPLKVFRVEVLGQLGRGGRLNVYYTSDERLDLRDFIRDVGQAVGARIELRQLGVRDEAKAVGGIGSCGLTLCCTTWLPDFVPVSIKMAKDQGLVLSPTKVSGQCGRLKCCLVYEQAGYAEMRKGLPKLGKRVIATRGEGRVVEVDVLRQRVRVSYGPGDTEVLPAAEVRPLFPSGNQPHAQAGGGPPGGHGGHDEPDEPEDSGDAGDAADDVPDPSMLPGDGDDVDAGSGLPERDPTASDE